MTCTRLLLAAGLLLGAPVLARALAPADFAYGREVRLEQAGALQELVLPPGVYRQAQNDWEKRQAADR